MVEDCEGWWLPGCRSGTLAVEARGRFDSQQLLAYHFPLSSPDNSVVLDFLVIKTKTKIDAALVR